MSRLTISRPRQYADILREYHVLIGDDYYLTIRRGQTLEVDLPPGRYRLIAEIDWCSSQPLEVELDEAGATWVEVGSNLAGWGLLLAAQYVSVWTDQYLYLKENSPWQGLAFEA